MSKVVKKVKSKIPRYVLSLTDLKNEMVGPRGKQAYNITVAVDDFSKFTEPIHEEDGGTELNRVMTTFIETSRKLDGEKLRIKADPKA